MLVLARKMGQEIVIDGDIVVKVLEIGRNTARLGITAPDGVKILRSELASEDDRDDPGQD